MTFAQGKHRVVLDEVSSSSPPEVQPVRMLADYHQNPGKRYAMKGWGMKGLYYSSDWSLVFSKTYFIKTAGKIGLVFFFFFQIVLVLLLKVMGVKPMTSAILVQALPTGSCNLF